MLTKMITSTTKSNAVMKKTSRLPPPRSFGLAVAIVIVIGAIYGLLLIALSTIATATGDPNERSIDDKYPHSNCDPTGLGSGDSCEIVTH